ncbi:MAG: aminopeptidase [bacterium]|nr:aminopeptidase [bacterium]
MGEREMFQEENESLRERYLLTAARIREIAEERTLPEPFGEYFGRTAGFYLLLEEILQKREEGSWEQQSLTELQEWNDRLYRDIFKENYETSFANPAYAQKKLGKEYGPLLCFLYAELRAVIPNAYEKRLSGLTELGELFIQIYNLFEEEFPPVESVKSAIYWFESDYADQTVVHRVREGVDPKLSFAADLIMHSDLSDLRYLYQFGEYISDSELAVASYLNALPQETIDKMADTYTEGFCRGFVVTGRDLSKKKSVVLRYALGFERMMRKAIQNFRQRGLEPILYRATVPSINRFGRAGYFASPANPQYDYDHRYDYALYLDKAFKDRRNAMLRMGYETYKKEAEDYAGPAVLETFGEAAFEPVNKPEAWALDEKQEEWLRELRLEASEIVNAYIPEEETSFTIIAFPIPDIGEHFEEIFAETIAINTLDYELYQGIQQHLIDALDEAECVQISGRGGNETALTVRLHRLEDAAKQTNFENCVADVNIPLGEVFTSPLLEGTNGLLHVQKVYIGGICFRDLKLCFEQGRVTEYTCANMPSEEESRKLVRQTIFRNQERLPMGEFAIGTNTQAYRMGIRYGIQEKLPILIAEKTGPHFAVGDTCYSWAEDVKVYNPDGKEIIARDNEISILRKEDVSKAYFNCHTDITIPYSELGDIWAVHADGTRTALLQEGRFVLAGTELLNEALDSAGESA